MKKFNPKHKILKNFDVDPWSIFLFEKNYSKFKDIFFFSFQKLLKKKIKYLKKYFNKNKKKFNIYDYPTYFFSSRKYIKKNQIKFLCNLKLKNEIYKKNNVFFFKKILEKKKNYSIYGTNFLIFRKLRLFYGLIPINQLKKIYKYIKKFQNNINSSFFFQIERRIDVVLFRTNLFKSFFFIKQIIRNKKLKINNSLISYKNFYLKEYDILFLNDFLLKIKLKNVFLLKIKKNIPLNNYPKYLEINYKIFSFSIVSSLFNINNLNYPTYLENFKIKEVLYNRIV